MATITSRIATNRQERLLTTADLAAFPSELPSGPVLWELDNGRLIPMTPRGGEHGSIEGRVGGKLYVQGERRRLGKVYTGETALILRRDPDRVVGMDVGFVGKASLPAILSPEGYLETIPDLVVEVRSKNDSGPYIKRKVADYLRAGVRVVWVVDPAARTATEHRRRAKPKVFKGADVLTIEDVIPGFRLKIREIFA